MFARIPARPIVRRIANATVIAALAAPAAGCDLMDAINENGGLVQMFATHHGTIENGDFPEAGGDERIFETYDGWTIRLEEGYVVTSAMTLVHCDGSGVETALYWGQLPESLTAPDLAVTNLGSVDAPAGQYCSVVVDYEPYDPWLYEGETHPPPESEELIGATMYLRGVAVRGEDTRVEFEVRSEERISVELDITDIEAGLPFTMKEREPYPRQLTVSKTYDRFFDEIAMEVFAEQASEDADEIVLDVLADETRISLGKVVSK